MKLIMISGCEFVTVLGIKDTNGLMQVMKDFGVIKPPKGTGKDGNLALEALENMRMHNEKTRQLSVMMEEKLAMIDGWLDKLSLPLVETKEQTETQEKEAKHAVHEPPRRVDPLKVKADFEKFEKEMQQSALGRKLLPLRSHYEMLSKLSTGVDETTLVKGAQVKIR